MKLKFLAKGIGPVSYEINGSVINGIDTSHFVEGSRFIGNGETDGAGIYDMFWRNGERHVVLGQLTKSVQFSIQGREGEWIDSADYDPSKRYVVATNPDALALIESGKAEWFLDIDGKWSVRHTQTEEQEV